LQQFLLILLQDLYLGSWAKSSLHCSLHIMQCLQSHRASIMPSSTNDLYQQPVLIHSAVWMDPCPRIASQYFVHPVVRVLHLNITIFPLRIWAQLLHEKNNKNVSF
jgi:hypothetical protein